MMPGVGDQIAAIWYDGHTVNACVVEAHAETVPFAFKVRAPNGAFRWLLQAGEGSTWARGCSTPDATALHALAALENSR